MCQACHARPWMAGARGDDVRAERSRSGLAGRRSKHERDAGRGERIKCVRLAMPGHGWPAPEGMMFAPSGADPAWPVGGANMSEPQDAASESIGMRIDSDRVASVSGGATRWG